MNEEMKDLVASYENVIVNHQKQIDKYRALIEEVQTDISSHVYDSLENASDTLEDSLSDKASEDCRLAGNFGQRQYFQEFIVDGKKYLGTLDVEYDRHDKTYYYVDSYSFSYKEIE